MTVLPSSGDRVAIYPDGSDEPLVSRLEEISSLGLVLTVRSDVASSSRLVPVGHEVLLEWATPGGVGRAHALVSARLEHEATLVVSLAGPVESTDRRVGGRVAARLDFVVRRLDAEGPTAVGRTIDVAHDGLLGRVLLDLEPDDLVELTLRLPDAQAIATRARVVRRGSPGVYGFRFIAIDEEDRERLTELLAAEPAQSLTGEKVA